MRQTQGSLVCSHCEKLVGINEPTCPFCGAWRPGLYGWAPVLQRLVGHNLDLFSLIVATCITLYAIALLLQPEEVIKPFRSILSILSPGGRALYQLGMTSGPALQDGWFWTLFTAIYLHGSLLHIVFNVMWIRNLGPEATEVFGPARAFVLFNVAGAFGFLVSNMMTGVPTMGASGGVFGLLAALIVYGRRRGSSMMSQQLWLWAIVLFVFGFLMPGINNWAHAGGFAGGWVCAYLMGFIDEQRESSAMVLLALAFVAVTAIGIILSFTKVTGIVLAG
ncbi:MAG: rhomboid family intramembrane serine protease [Vicinamibacterales bacterium]|nr:rhomboid family intramembrane serine protease [Vicinamibacterales bacterium]HJO17828.1 rhomboid family intramembrane serine protease [Vicinamibacterales bacterium]|tara:strand:- start:823 stop:1656 length:834 start_codon:yes stop_codon:yes gene_type:complete